MQNSEKELLKQLEDQFKNIRKTDLGFKFNVEKLDRTDLTVLNFIQGWRTINIKRSGTGLVVIIE